MLFVIIKKEGLTIIRDIIYDGIDPFELSFSSMHPTALSLSPYLVKKPVQMSVKVESSDS